MGTDSRMGVHIRAFHPDLRRRVRRRLASRSGRRTSDQVRPHLEKRRPQSQWKPSPYEYRMTKHATPQARLVVVRMLRRR